MDPAENKIKIEVPNFSLNHPESYCRFCYAGTDLISIFPPSGGSCQQIIDWVYQLMNISLSVAEDFPSAICRQCLGKLEQFDRFRQNCRIHYDLVRQRRIEYAGNDSTVVKYEVMDQKYFFELPSAHSETVFKDEVPNLDEEMVEKEVFVTQPGHVELQPGHSNAVPKEPLVKGRNQYLGFASKPQSKNKFNPNRKSLFTKLSKRKTTVAKIKQPKVELQDYRCKVCGKFFTDKESINVHMKKHIDTDNFRCCNCSKTSESIQGLMTHAIQSYILTSFPCKFCNVHLKTREKYITHEFYCEKNRSSQNVQETANPEQCGLCPKYFDTKHGLQSHMLLHDRQFNCKKCGVDLPSAYHLKNHEDRYHAPGTKVVASTVKCEPCQRTFVDASAYRNHHTKFHENQEDQISRKLEENKLYECDTCGKRFWSINTIRYHVLVHRKYLDCDRCTESFHSRQDLRDHKMEQHPVTCSFCPLKLFSEKSCRSHCTKMHGMLHVKQLASDDPSKVTYAWRRISFKCANCEQDYDQFGQLQDHYHWMHSESKVRIKCNYCDKCSTSRIGYVSHLIGNCGKTPKKMK